MSPTRASRLRVVVDGSNLATEGRTVPSLVQLDEAVRAFIDENPAAEVIVVVDASFEHRVVPGERHRFKESELAGEIVTPPAGAVGRGDAFILKIAARINGVVLSNDSFQEFHDEYPWLFDDGRLIGGKPVPGVGWVFTPRLPVRGAKSVRVSKKAAEAKPAVAVKKAAKAPAPTVKKAAKAVKAPAKKSAKPSDVAKKESVRKEPPAKAPSEPVKKAAKALKAPAKKAAKAAAATVTPEPVVALRRGRQPVNPEVEFKQFVSSHKPGSRVEGEVTAFTSHGAVIKVATRSGGLIECYAPTTQLGTPPPPRARDVLQRGDRRSFKLVTVDLDRRIAELSLL